MGARVLRNESHSEETGPTGQAVGEAWSAERPSALHLSTSLARSHFFVREESQQSWAIVKLRGAPATWDNGGLGDPGAGLGREWPEAAPELLSHRDMSGGGLAEKIIARRPPCPVMGLPTGQWCGMRACSWLPSEIEQGRPRGNSGIPTYRGHAPDFSSDKGSRPLLEHLGVGQLSSQA